jgi:hypothetical protein
MLLKQAKETQALQPVTAFIATNKTIEQRNNRLYSKAPKIARTRI